MRPIDADALGNRMYHESFEKDSDLQRWDGGCWIRYKLFEQVLRAAPTIDTPNTSNTSNTLGVLDCVDRRLVSYKLTDLVNEFEEILSHIREREENDSVCGLCEYDGAYMGQSGDWCNECPGFDKADCFKLKDKYKKEWLELMNTLPSVQPKLSNNSKELDNKNGELISRQAAIDNLMEILDRPNHAEFLYTDEICGVLKNLPSAQLEPCEDAVSRNAIIQNLRGR